MKKSTSELLELMKNYSEYTQYLSENREDINPDHMKLDRALNILLIDKSKRKADVIAASGIESHYAYQIFSGMKTPTRDKVLMLCIAFGLTPEETNNFLRLTGYAQLYGKEGRDNAVLFGLTKHLSVIDVNEILYELGFSLLN